MQRPSCPASFADVKSISKDLSSIAICIYFHACLETEKHCSIFFPQLYPDIRAVVKNQTRLPQRHSSPPVVCPAHRSACTLSEIRKFRFIFMFKPTTATTASPLSGELYCLWISTSRVINGGTTSRTSFNLPNFLHWPQQQHVSEAVPVVSQTPELFSSNTTWSRWNLCDTFFFLWLHVCGVSTSDIMFTAEWPEPCHSAGGQPAAHGSNTVYSQCVPWLQR